LAAAPGVHRLRARNTAASSDNRIHDDAVARRYGFGGGLVPGVTVYAYLTRPIVEAWGPRWLERGTMDVRFVAPFYDGDDVVVEPEQASEADGTRAVELRATNGEGRLCATADAGLPEAPSEALSLEDWPVVPLPEPDQRRPATRDALQDVEALGTLGATFRTDVGAGYVEAVGDDLALYRGPDAVAHPGWLLSLANYVLASNVALGPWIHTASEVRHLGRVTDGDRISVRARVLDLSEARGHELVHLDVLMVVGARAVQRVRHSAIYRLRPAAQTTS
jgi:acyl dehydratase